jgi:hypothetical protein
MALLTTLDNQMVAYYDPNDGSLYLHNKSPNFSADLNTLIITSLESNLIFSNFKDYSSSSTIPYYASYSAAEFREFTSSKITLREAVVTSSFYTMNINSRLDFGNILPKNKDQNYLNDNIILDIVQTYRSSTNTRVPIVMWPDIILPNEKVSAPYLNASPSELIIIYDNTKGSLTLANNSQVFSATIELIDLYSPTNSFLGFNDINIIKNQKPFSPTNTPVFSTSPTTKYWYHASKNELYASMYNATYGPSLILLSRSSYVSFDKDVMAYNNIGNGGTYLPRGLSIEQLKSMIGTNPILDPESRCIASQFLYRLSYDPIGYIRRGYVVDSRVLSSSYNSVYGTFDFPTTATPTPTISLTPSATPCPNITGPFACDNFYVAANKFEWQDTGIQYGEKDIVYFTATGCVNLESGQQGKTFNVDSSKEVDKLILTATTFDGTNETQPILQGRAKYANGTYSSIFPIYSSGAIYNFGGSAGGRIELRVGDPFWNKRSLSQASDYQNNLGGFCVCIKKRIGVPGEMTPIDPPTGPCIANNISDYPRPSSTPTNTPTKTNTATPVATRTSTPTSTPTPTSTRCIYNNNLLKNASFENGLTDWTFNNSNVLTKDSNPLFFTNVSDNGSSIVSLLSYYNGCVSQEFNTDPGSSYIIRFKYSAETTNKETQIEYLLKKLTVNIGDYGTAAGQCLITNGINKDFIFDNRLVTNHTVEGTTEGINNTNVVWLDGVLVFNATSSRSRIVFQDTTTSSNPERFSNTGILLDSISICGTPNETRTPTPTKTHTPTITPTISPTNTVTPTITPTFYKNSSLKIKHYVGINDSQDLYSWGENNKGQLGQGDTIDRSVPTIFNIPNWKKIITNPYFDTVSPDDTVGNVWYGIKTNNTLWEWRESENLNPQVGNRSPQLLFMTNDIGNFVFKNNSSIYFINSNNKKLYTYDLIKKIKSKIPIINEEITDIVSIAPNFFAVLYSGETDLLISLGGDDSFLKFNKDEYSQLSANANGSLLAIKNDGTIWSMGNNNYGKLGNGSTSYVQFPTKISNKTWKYISSGKNHTMAIDTEGQIYGWGFNGYGQLGDGTALPRFSPTISKNLVSLDWISIYAGDTYSIARKDNKSLYGWGRNNEYMLGTGNNFDSITPVSIMGQWDDISIYNNSIFALGEPPPSNTPTPTITPTNTTTTTKTPTPTQTVTGTSTCTPTNTSTFTITPSPTNTATPTTTQTCTNTQTPTQSQTATISPTVTNSVTPTQTTTTTATPTNTATTSATPTNTPTNTQTATSSCTPTLTNTLTNTSTPTLTPSESPTPTTTPTLTPSPTNTATPTNTITPSVSISPSVTTTSTPTPTIPLNGGYYYGSSTVEEVCFPSVMPIAYINIYDSNNLEITDILYKDIYGSVNWTFTELLDIFNLSYDNTYMVLRKTDNTGPIVIVTRSFGDDNVIVAGLQSICPTRTPTPTNTATNTNTPTITPSNSATPTPSITASNTPTVSLSGSNTPTPTITQTSTITPSNTTTPTITPSNTTTNTPTPTSTPAYIYKSINMNIFRVIPGNQYRVDLTTDNIGLAKVTPDTINFMATSDPQRINCRLGFAANVASVMLHVKVTNLNTGALEYNSIAIKCNDILDCY